MALSRAAQATIAGGAVGALILLLRAPRFNYGGPDSANGLSRDPTLLLPAFARKLNLLFAAMRARGLDPMLNEGRRSRARAEALSKEPGAPGIADSMHIYGAAADIISASKGFKDPAFFKALGEEADKLGLFWGGHFKTRPDSPHIQALAVAEENKFRALAKAGGDLNAFVAQELAA